MNNKKNKVKQVIDFINNSNEFNLIAVHDNLVEYEDIDGYKYVKNILRSKINTKDKYSKSNKYNILNINKMLNGDSVIIEDSYISAKEKCLFRCKCGNIYSSWILPMERYKYKLCSDCRRKTQKTKLTPYEKMKNEVEGFGCKLLEYSNGTHNRITVEDENGYKGKISIFALRNNGGKISKFALRNPYALENIQKYVKEQGYGCIVPNQKYNGYGKPLKLICECGNIFYTTIDNLVYLNKHRCNKCSRMMSELEQKVEEWINELNLEYEGQKRFPDCYYKQQLPFDFYLKEYNICIEVQGEQHYRVVNFCGNKEKAKKAFELQKKKDEIKRKYCKTHNIKLIELKYDKIRESKINLLKDFI